MKIKSFLKQTYTEMKQVVWPSRKRAVIYAIVVILFSAGLGYLLFGFDALFGVLLQKLVF